MTESRHTPTRPHYLRFAIVLAGLSGCATSTQLPDGSAAPDSSATPDMGAPFDASVPGDSNLPVDSNVAANDCYVTPSPRPIGSWGDGGCYYTDDLSRAPCPPSCYGADVTVGPLAPPDLPA